MKEYDGKSLTNQISPGLFKTGGIHGIHQTIAANNGRSPAVGQDRHIFR